MNKRKIMFQVSEYKATLISRCSPDSRMTAIDFIGGSGVSLIALHDAIDQLQYLYSEVDWRFEIDPTMPSDHRIAYLLPIQVSK